jgi:hypothetical protein
MILDNQLKKNNLIIILEILITSINLHKINHLNKMMTSDSVISKINLVKMILNNKVKYIIFFLKSIEDDLYSIIYYYFIRMTI